MCQKTPTRKWQQSIFTQNSVYALHILQHTDFISEGGGWAGKMLLISKSADKLVRSFIYCEWEIHSSSFIDIKHVFFALHIKTHFLLMSLFCFCIPNATETPSAFSLWMLTQCSTDLTKRQIISNCRIPRETTWNYMKMPSKVQESTLHESAPNIYLEEKKTGTYSHLSILLFFF